MKVLLKENVKGIGNRGDVVDVKDGFARNMLLPNNKALIASKKMELQAEQMRKAQATKNKKIADFVEASFNALNSSNITISAKAGTNEKLFGSVTVNEIAVAIGSQLNIEVDKKQVQEVEHIKTLGDHKVLVKLDSSHLAEINVSVINDGGTSK
jgi:large subunit ribosomal protein L9